MIVAADPIVIVGIVGGLAAFLGGIIYIILWAHWARRRTELETAILLDKLRQRDEAVVRLVEARKEARDA